MEPEINNNSFNQNTNVNPNNGVYIEPVINTSSTPVYNDSPINYSKNNDSKKKIIKIIVIVILLLVAGIVLYKIFGPKQAKLVCTSDEGSITIRFTSDGIAGYSANGITYDISSQREALSEIGLKEYILEFNSWFRSNTTGTCSYEGRELDGSSNSDNLVGKKGFGYVSVPEDWIEYNDPDAPDVVQYSYAGLFIVTLDVNDGAGYTAETIANTYLATKKNDPEVTGITTDTVTIGKTKKYTATVITMFYPNENIYQSTYWFDGEDDMIHYISLEGPEKVGDKRLTDFEYIPNTFRLTK